MSVQRQFDAVKASPIDARTALDGFTAGRVANVMSHRDLVCPQWIRDSLSVDHSLYRGRLCHRRRRVLGRGAPAC